MPLCLHLPSVLCENFCCWTAPGGNFADGWIFEGRLPRSLLPFDPVSRLFIGPFSSLPKQVEIGCVTFFVSSQNGAVILLDPLLLLLQSDALVSGEQQGPCTLQFPPGGGLHLVEGPGPVEGSSGQPPLRSQQSPGGDGFFLEADAPRACRVGGPAWAAQALQSQFRPAAGSWRCARARSPPAGPRARTRRSGCRRSTRRPAHAGCWRPGGSRAAPPGTSPGRRAGP